MGIYTKNIELFEKAYQKVKSKHKIVGAIRLVMFLGIVYCFYLSVSRSDFTYLYICGGFVVLFIILLKIHADYSWKMSYAQALLQVNQDEVDFLENKKWPFEDGKEFLTLDHPYAYDLDIFGPKSLYQALNRTSSYIGQEKLADLLKYGLDQQEILANQQAIKELSQNLDWRQQINAYSRLCNLDKDTYQRLKNWSLSVSKDLSSTTRFLSYLIPAILGVSILVYIFYSSLVVGYVISTAFSLNLILSISKSRDIQRELGSADKVHQTINSYSEIVKRIEKQSFTTPKMKHFLELLKRDNFKTSKELKTLSNLFEKLETVGNLFIMILFNGLGQYHIHVLDRLIRWKNKNSKVLLSAIDVVGQIEALNSLANFSYNNRDYTFANYNNKQTMEFKELGHPLLNPQKRVCNDISFKQHRFVILTGSNMSGKSTFLRTIGVNLVLANMGAPICASSANLFVLPLFVSMRLTDSLDDSESYFYAEVKRLKMIMENAQKQPCFVLLDEILRGTNSDDKQSGTIGVITKLIQSDTFGVIATHDLEVCNTTLQYPDILTNKCFEVEIKNDDLFFDYKIRSGVCQNKNATFIMKKMGIIN
ncbi:MutS-related protein [Myroides sp. LJL119]